MESPDMSACHRGASQPLPWPQRARGSQRYCCLFSLPPPRTPSLISSRSAPSLTVVGCSCPLMSGGHILVCLFTGMKCSALASSFDSRAALPRGDCRIDKPERCVCKFPPVVPGDGGEERARCMRAGEGSAYDSR